MKTFLIYLRIPPDTPPDESFFLAGNFNQWIPDDRNFRFEPGPEGKLQLSVASNLPLLECKVTRGDWSCAECRKSGEPVPNRLIRTAHDPAELTFDVLSWADRHVGMAAQAEIHLLHPAIDMPQLGRKRRIWALLPPGYRSNPDKRYPVIYMQDGQNLFDNAQAVFGSWNVDKALNRLFMSSHTPGMHLASEALVSTIIIGIENGGDHRISEYSPWVHPKHGGGAGKRYLSFITDTLKPFVDDHLRTLKGREHTGILGSSMGGLISLYAALGRPDVFGMAGVFSPSLWFSSAVFSLAKTPKKDDLPVKILLMAGHRESETMVGDLLSLYESLLEAGHSEEHLHYDLHSDGAHAEWFWAREFEHALSWLLQEGEQEHHEHVFHNHSVVFERAEDKKEITLRLNQPLRSPVLEIHDYCHDRVFRHPFSALTHTVSYAAWEDCIYAVRLLSDDDLIFSRRIHLSQLEEVQAGMITSKIKQL